MDQPDRTFFIDRVDFFELIAAGASALPGDSTQSFLIERVAIAAYARDHSEGRDMQEGPDEISPSLLTRLVNRWRMTLQAATGATTDPDAGPNAKRAFQFRWVHAGPAEGDSPQGH